MGILSVNIDLMDSLFFWLSKILWVVAAPDNFLALVFFLGLLALLSNKFFLAKLILVPAIMVVLLITTLPIGEWLLHPLETRFKTNPDLPSDIDGIIVLGGAEEPLMSEKWRQTEVNFASERQLAFLNLARRYPKAKLVYSGGTDSMVYQSAKGADVAERLYRQQSINIDRVTLERESRNTYENAIYSKQLLKPAKNEKWILITTAWHMPRSVGVFCQAGWSVIPYPVDHWVWPENRLFAGFNLAGNLTKLQTGVKEWLGLLAYFVSNKTDRFVSVGC